MRLIRKISLGTSSQVSRYGIAAASVAVALGVRLALDPLLARESPFILFLLAVMVTARYGGRIPGLVVTVLGALNGWYFLTEPRNGVEKPGPSEMISLVLFGVAGAVISLGSGKLHQLLIRARENENRFRLLTETPPEIIWTADNKGRCDYLNSRGLVYLGVCAEDVRGDMWLERIHPDDRGLFREKWMEASAGSEFRAEYRLRRHDGVYRWFDARARALWDDEGRATKWFGSSTDVHDERETRAALERDIADRKRAEEALREAEGRLQFALEATNTGYWELNLSDYTTNGSAHHSRIYGYDAPVPDWSYEKFLSHVLPEDRERLKMSPDSPRTNSDGILECRIRRTDGEIRWIWVNSRHVPESKGGAERVVGITLDITERKRAEELVQQQKEREMQQLRAFVAEAPAAMALFDRQMRYVQASKRWMKETGIDGKEIIGKSHYEVFPNLPPEWKVAHRRGLAGEVLTGVGEHFVAPDGFDRWLNWEIRPWGNQGVETGGIIIYSEDISARKRAEGAAQKSELEYRALFQHMAEGLSYSRMIFEDGKPVDYLYLAVNESFERLTGLKNPAGKRVSEVLPGIREADPGLFERFGRVAFTGEPESFEVWVEVLKKWFSISCYSPEPGDFVNVFTEISDRKRADEEIRRLNAELEERVRLRTTQLEAANRELEAFTYSVSHDLRAPLRGIDSWSLALMEDYGPMLDEQAQRYLGRVRSEAERMGLLIDDLLELSRVGQREMKIHPVDLSAMAATIAGQLQEYHPQRRIEFIIEEGLQAQGDPRLLQIAMTNLLDNAIKFTAPREVARLEIGRCGDGSETCFFVRDNGVGFDMKYASTLFGAFQRMHSSSEFPGTGIGLATVRRVISRHGGRVWAQSQVDQGATFYFTIGGLP